MTADATGLTSEPTARNPAPLVTIVPAITEPSAVATARLPTGTPGPPAAPARGRGAPGDAPAPPAERPARSTSPAGTPARSTSPAPPAPATPPGPPAPPDPGSVAPPPAPGEAPAGRHTHLVAPVVGVVGALVVATLVWLTGAVNAHTQAHLLHTQTETAGLVLGEVVPSITSPLDTALAAAEVSGGDPKVV